MDGQEQGQCLGQSVYERIEKDRKAQCVGGFWHYEDPQIVQQQYRLMTKDTLKFLVARSYFGDNVFRNPLNGFQKAFVNTLANTLHEYLVEEFNRPDDIEAVVETICLKRVTLQSALIGDYPDVEGIADVVDAMLIFIECLPNDEYNTWLSEGIYGLENPPEEVTDEFALGAWWAAWFQMIAGGDIDITSNFNRLNSF
jgi:hypothetical protein